MPIRTLLVLALFLAPIGPFAGPTARADTLDLLRASQDEAAIPAADADLREIDPFGAVGTRSWWVGGVGGVEFGINQLAAVRGGVDWFIATDFSLGLQADLGWAATKGDRGGLLLGVAPMLRWHFLNRERWSLFAEVGVGLAWTTVRIPEGGSRLNFTPQAAIGFTHDLEGDWRLGGTLGWYHMSNARTSNNNPGLDAVAITVGIGRSF